MPEITGGTRLVGVMGWPIAHSMSPPMHNAAFCQLGMDCCYVPLPVHPDDLPQAVAGLRALGFVGCNVTIPHKQGVWGCVDQVSEDAQAVGAVNTLIPTENGWYGGNSDIPGFLWSLKEAGYDPMGKGALVLGAGGAARGIVYALAKSGAQVHIANRTVARAETLAAEITGLLPTAQIESLPLVPRALRAAGDGASLVVNTTSLGMWPHADRSPWPDGLPFPRHAIAFDSVYNPLRTRFLHQAAQAGAATITGLKMLVYQGAVSFEWWFDVAPPTDLMYAVCLQHLGRS